MITRLARLELASLFFELAAEYRIGDRFSDTEFIEAWMIGSRNDRWGRRSGVLKFVQPMIDLFDSGKESRRLDRLRFSFDKLCDLLCNVVRR